MSNYTDFVNNYMKNRLNEADVNAQQKSDDAVANAKALLSDKDNINKKTTFAVTNAMLTLAIHDPESFKLLFKYTKCEGEKISITNLNDPKKVIKLPVLLSGSSDVSGTPIFNAISNMLALMQDPIDGSALEGIKESDIDKLKNTAKNISANTKHTMFKYLTSERKLDKAIQQFLADVQQKSASLGKLETSFEAYKDQWEKFGECITFISVEMLSDFAHKGTEIKASDMQNAMAAAFTGESKEYQATMNNMEEKMEIDAVFGVMEDVAKHDNEADRKAKKTQESYNIKLDNLLIEQLDEETARKYMPTDASYYASIKKDSKKKADLLNAVNACKLLHPEEFKKAMNALEVKFDTGRTKILEEEKKDTEEMHEDPTGRTKPVKRIGRLGNHGPMTFINNNDNLKKSVEAIEGQQWNIFNCAAKLMIKFMKLIESGSKGLQKFKEEMAAGQKQIRDSFNKTKITDFIQRASDIEEENVDGGPTEGSDKIFAELENLSVALRKYENEVLLVLNQNANKPWFAQKDGEDGEKLAVINGEIGVAVQQKLDLLKSVAKVWNVTDENIKKIVEEKPEEETEETQEATPEAGAEGSSEAAPNPEATEKEEAPQQAASYKNPNKNIIKEKDEVMDDTQKAIQAASKEAQANAKPAGKEDAAATGTDAEAEASKEASKETTDDATTDSEKSSTQTFEVAKWRDQKFNFNLDTMPLDFGKMTSEHAKILSETYGLYAKYSDGNAKTNLEALRDYFALLNTQLKLEEGRYLIPEEATISSITAGQFIDGCTALFNKLNEIVPNMNEIKSLGVVIPKDKVQEFTQELQKIQTVDKFQPNGPDSLVQITVGTDKTSDTPVDKEGLQALTQNVQRGVQTQQLIVQTSTGTEEGKMKQFTLDQYNKIIQQWKAINGAIDGVQRGKLGRTLQDKSFDTKEGQNYKQTYGSLFKDEDESVIKKLWGANRLTWILNNFKLKERYEDTLFNMLYEVDEKPEASADNAEQAKEPDWKALDAELKKANEMLKIIMTPVQKPEDWKRDELKKIYGMSLKAFTNGAWTKWRTQVINIYNALKTWFAANKDNEEFKNSDLQNIMAGKAKDPYLILLACEFIISLKVKGNAEAKPEEDKDAQSAEAKPEGQSAEGKQEKPKQDATIKDNLNWLANEFYKYIRG